MKCAPEFCYLVCQFGNQYSLFYNIAMWYRKTHDLPVKLPAEDARCRYQTPLWDKGERPKVPTVWWPTVSTKFCNAIEKLNYVRAFPLPTLSRRSSFPLRSAFKNSSFSSTFGDLTFLIMTNKINLSSATYSGTHYGIPDSFMIYAWQSYIVRVNSAWCVTVDRCITASTHSHLLRGVAQRGSCIEGLGCRL